MSTLPIYPSQKWWPTEASVLVLPMATPSSRRVTPKPCLSPHVRWMLIYCYGVVRTASMPLKWREDSLSPQEVQRALWVPGIGLKERNQRLAFVWWTWVETLTYPCDSFSFTHTEHFPTRFKVTSLCCMSTNSRQTPMVLKPSRSKRSPSARTPFNHELTLRNICLYICHRNSHDHDLLIVCDLNLPSFPQLTYALNLMMERIFPVPYELPGFVPFWQCSLNPEEKSLASMWSFCCSDSCKILNRINLPISIVLNTSAHIVLQRSTATWL